MADPQPLLPTLGDRAHYEAMQPDAHAWRPAMQAICLRHALAADGLVRLSEGTNVVFATGAQLIIKLYPPYGRRLFIADRLVAEHVYGKLGIATPAIVAYGELEGWPYLVMERLTGRYLNEIWDEIAADNQTAIAAELGALTARLHVLPTHGLDGLDADWPTFVDNCLRGCVQRHRDHGMAEAWLQQLPTYLAQAQPLYPESFRLAIVSGDIHHYHLLAADVQGRWRLTGLFDFDDARLGFHEYDLAASGLFLMHGRPLLLRTFLQAYGYSDTDLDEALSRRLLAYTLLHRYRIFNWWRDTVVGDRTCTTFEQLASAIYPLG